MPNNRQPLATNAAGLCSKGIVAAKRDRLASLDLMRSFQLTGGYLSAKPEARYTLPQTHCLQDPNAYTNYYDYVQDSLDTRRHRNIPIDERQGYADDNQYDDQIQ